MPNHLLVCPPLNIQILADGRAVFEAKFFDGMLAYARHWDGPMSVYAPASTVQQPAFNTVVLPKNELPFRLETGEFSALTADRLRDLKPDIVLACVHYQQNHIAGACRQAGVACVYYSEYTLTTRRQIVHATTPNPLRRLRKYWWEYQQEQKLTAALRISAGVQCNGTPTFDVYKKINPHTLLYFDTRTSQEMLATDGDIQHRLGDSTRPLRLIFSGRLTSMKGVQHLVPIALALRKKGIPFQLTICGDDDLKPAVEAAIQKNHLDDVVHLPGVLEFKSQLVPLVKTAADLFVCCHPQGDPSCTYLETMACGVPIAGYANEAFQGLHDLSRAGWCTPLGNPDRLASILAEIHHDRAALLQMSQKSLAFARQHTLEITMQARMDHLRKALDRTV